MRSIFFFLSCFKTLKLLKKKNFFFFDLSSFTIMCLGETWEMEIEIWDDVLVLKLDGD